MTRAPGPTVAAVASLIVLAALLWLLRPQRDPAGGGAARLTLFCAAGIKPPVEELARLYEERYGVAIAMQYGGSGTLLSSLRIAPEGDLYLAADDSFIERARELGLVDEALPLATMRPVIAVRAGNPAGVTGAEDLLREDLVVGLADPNAAAVGVSTREMLSEAGHWEAVARRVKVFKPTVTELANDLVLGAIEAAVVWDATVAQYPKLEAIRVPAFDRVPREVTIGVLRGGQHPREALRFARFLAARDEGAAVFERHGYVPIEGDAWDPAPRLTLMSGAMLNGALRETIAAFEEREGVRIDTSFNGCGLLVAQMRAGQVPDAYFSCDESFLALVGDLFEPGTVVSSNPIVILVQPGNPEGVRGLADLCREGLRVGLAHPEKSALGALTRRLLEREGLARSFDASGNLTLDSPTGDYLVNQIRTGSLDAVVVYRSNAANVGNHLELVEVGLEGARTSQPFAVARDSRHRRLVGRLLEAILSADSRARFEQLGFGWERDQAR